MFQGRPNREHRTRAPRLETRVLCACARHSVNSNRIQTISVGHSERPDKRIRLDINRDNGDTNFSKIRKNRFIFF